MSHSPLSYRCLLSSRSHDHPPFRFGHHPPSSFHDLPSHHFHYLVCQRLSSRSVWCRLNFPHHPVDHPPSWLHDYHPDPLRKITNYKQWGCENMLKNMSSHSMLSHTKCHTPAACSLRCESVASKENKEQGRNIPGPFCDTCCPSPGPPFPTRSPTPPPSPPPPCSPSPCPPPLLVSNSQGAALATRRAHSCGRPEVCR